MAYEDITTLSQEEMDAVIYDSREGDLETIKEIFEEIGPKTLTVIQDDITLSTPLHMAAANGHLELVKYFFSILTREDAVKLANQKNESGNTALHWAAFSGHLPVVQLLCEEYEVDPFEKNASGHDAIYEAENNNQIEVETWFLSKYAVEDDFKIEEDGEDTKITYAPGKESKEAEERAAAAAETTKSLEEKTENLDIKEDEKVKIGETEQEEK
ncbi:ankyrin repeat-containing domain protein [Scheffersomyces xylosifermentans]|uniref:ankyrin repeat-containing domain protein n=1 Tax=Scheffersomyces xylosifermentans TaxID=1304137 RepID=UPI00315CF965